jgi:hypothetical protein
MSRIEIDSKLLEDLVLLCRECELTEKAHMRAINDLSNSGEDFRMVQKYAEKSRTARELQREPTRLRYRNLLDALQQGLSAAQIEEALRRFLHR